MYRVDIDIRRQEMMSVKQLITIFIVFDVKRFDNSNHCHDVLGLQLEYYRQF